jgi:hypothetical protein
MSVLQSKVRSLGLGVVPAFAVAMLPKCPLCWMAILGALGLGSIISLAWLQGLTILFLAVALGALAFRARRIHRYGPLLLGAAAAAAVYFFKFVVDLETAVYAAGASLIAASVWNSLLRPRGPAPAGCNCAKHLEAERPAISNR